MSGRVAVEKGVGPSLAKAEGSEVGFGLRGCMCGLGV